MTDNVINFCGVSRLPSDPDRVLQRATAAGLTSVVVVGFDSDGGEFFASSEADGGTVIWHLERAKLKLLRTPEELGA